MTREEIEAIIARLEADVASLKDPREAMVDLSSVNSHEDTKTMARNYVDAVDLRVSLLNSTILALNNLLGRGYPDPIPVEPTPSISADALEQSRTMSIAASLLSMPQAEQVNVTLGQPVNK